MRHVPYVVMWRALGSRSIWWYASLMSSFENTVLWLNSCRTSSTVGIGYRSLMTACFAFLMSTHSRMSFLFGTTTTSKTNRLGASIFSTMPCCTSSSSSSPDFLAGDMWFVDVAVPQMLSLDQLESSDVPPFESQKSLCLHSFPCKSKQFLGWLLTNIHSVDFRGLP